jgi:D-lactate dehydrogenase
VEEEVDRCVECGYCEPVCPSKDLTLTPRQRIVGRREIAAAEASGDGDLARRLREEYDYEGLQTCAVDGMCATACPVNINTGDLVRRLREENHSVVADRIWGAAASAWGTTTRIAGVGLSVANAFPPALPRAVTSVGRAVLGSDQVPHYQDLLPGGGRRRPAHKDEAATAVFFPACVASMFGTPDGTGLSVSEAFLALCERAGVAITIPDGIEAACCGTPWKSKGLPSGYRTMAPRTLQMLWDATDEGRLPVVCDASSCTEGLGAMRDLAIGSPKYSKLRFVDAVEFVAEKVLPHLTVTKPLDSLVVHQTCSSIHLGITGALEKVSQAVASKVVLPQEWGCCAYAGDRGMLHPELTASATAREAAEINSGQYEAFASLNRTCEQGMTEATGRPFWHVLQHLEMATQR